MKSRGVLGKRITRIEQEVRVHRDGGERVNVVSWIELEDGTRLVPHTIETDFGDYFHEIIVRKPVRKPADEDDAPCSG